MRKNHSALKSQLLASEAFIFDMDGTVVDLENLNFVSFKKVIEMKLNLRFTNEDYQQYISGRGSRNGLESYLISKKQNLSHVDDLQNGYRKLKRKALIDDFEHAVSTMNYVPEVLNTLKKQNIKTCLATSTGPEFAGLILSKTGLTFDITLTRADVKKIKPHPDIFLLALDKLDTDRAHAVVFEDSLNGIRASKSAGIFTVAIHNKGQNDGYIDEADAIIDSFRTVYEMMNSHTS